MTMIEFKFIEGDCFKLRLPEDDFELINMATAIPGAKYLKKGKYWKWPLSVRIYRQLKEAFKVKSEELDLQLTTYQLQAHNNKPQSEPFAMHQHEAVYRSLKDMGFRHVNKPKEWGVAPKPLLPRGFALFMEMGTRKTATSINIVDTLHVNGYIKTCMVIVDLSIVDTWANPDPKAGELARHSSVDHLTFTATGNKATSISRHYNRQYRE